MTKIINIVKFLAEIASYGRDIYSRYDTNHRLCQQMAVSLGFLAEKGVSPKKPRAPLLVMESSLPPSLPTLLTPNRCFRSFKREKSALGIFAIENSNGEVVTEYLPAIAKHRFSRYIPHSHEFGIYRIEQNKTTKLSNCGVWV